MLTAETVERVEGPQGIKGAYFSTTVTMDEIQLSSLATLLRIKKIDSLKSGTTDWITLGSKVSPNYPWIVQTSVSSLDPRTYRVTIEGRQPD